MLNLSEVDRQIERLSGPREGWGENMLFVEAKRLISSRICTVPRRDARPHLKTLFFYSVFLGSGRAGPVLVWRWVGGRREAPQTSSDVVIIRQKFRQDSGLSLENSTREPCRRAAVFNRSAHSAGPTRFMLFLGYV